MDFKISSRFACSSAIDEHIKLERYFDKEFQIELRKNIYIYIILYKENMVTRTMTVVSIAREKLREENGNIFLRS